VDVLDEIAERRIAEAYARGEFAGLPGEGRPIELDDDRLVAPELRVAYRLLRNSGHVPDEVRLLGELGSAEQLIREATSDEERAAASTRLRLLLERLGAGRALPLQLQACYFERLLDRMQSTART
jgi:hypothetical protein